MSQITYFEPGEIALLQHLPSDTPYAIRNVSQTQFSIARHYGGCSYNGQHYTYFPPGDELIRDDVFKLVAKTRRAKKKKPTTKKVKPVASATLSESNEVKP